MSEETQVFPLKKEKENKVADLENLLEIYIKKSEELEERESRVLQQVELIQSAVASLQAWKNSRKSSLSDPESVPSGLNDIEEETKKIRIETQKIQEEIQEKMTENKLLEEELERRKLLENEKEIQSIYEKMMEDEMMIETLTRKEIESRSNSKVKTDSERPSFEEKLLKLEEMEKKLKKELMLGSEEFKKKSKTQSEKIALLEWESLIHKEFIENLKKQNK